MNHATLEDFDRVYSYYQKYKVWFPHVRTDKLKRVIEEADVSMRMRLFSPITFTNEEQG